MAKFLTTTAIVAAIEKIIRDAQRELVIITPYVQMSKNVVTRLQDVSLKNVPVKVLFGKKQPRYEEIKVFESLSNVEMYFLEHLHAKCYYNEQQMVLTSMNLY